MNKRPVKICKHKKTFVDDFLDAFDKVADVLTCEKNIKKNFFNFKRKRNDDLTVENANSNIKDKNYGKRSNSKSRKTQTKSNVTDISRNASTPNVRSGRAAELRADDCTKEKGANDYFNKNVTNKRNIEEKVCFEKSIEELILRSQETIKEQEKIIELYDTTGYLNTFNTRCHCKTIVKTSDSCTQYEDCWLSDPEEYHNAGYLMDNNGASALGRSWSGTTRNKLEQSRAKECLTGGATVEDLYANYKSKYGNVLNPPPTWEKFIVGSEQQIPMPQPKIRYNTESTQYYQEQLRKAYNYGTPIKSSRNMRNKGLSVKGKSEEITGGKQQKCVPNSQRALRIQSQPASTPNYTNFQTSMPYSSTYCTEVAMDDLDQYLLDTYEFQRWSPSERCYSHC